MAVKPIRGFTLVESIIAIIIMAFAMLSLVTLFFPRIEDSARPHYEVRAVALAQSMMTEVLAKNFDENSDTDGGVDRCGETGMPSCSTSLGSDGEANPGLYNDVDDYIGCWTTNTQSASYCTQTQAGNLNDIFGNDISADYPDFAANISVSYDNDSNLTNGHSDVIKRIQIEITAGKYGSYTFSAFRGNY